MPAANGDQSSHRTAPAGAVLSAVAAGAPIATARVAAALHGQDVRLACVVTDASWLPEAAAREHADVAILIHPAGRRSRNELGELRRRLDAAGAAVDLPIVAVIAESERRHARTLIEAGVAGIVLDAGLPATLVATLRAVCAGQLAYPRPLRTMAERPALTYRERQVLGLVAMGFTNGEIAAKLWLAESTVKSHLSSAFGKLGVRSRSEAAALVLDPAERLGAGILALGGGEQLAGNGVAG